MAITKKTKTVPKSKKQALASGTSTRKGKVSNSRPAEKHRGTGSTDRTLRKAGREATRAREYGEKTEVKETKRIEKLESKRKSIPATNKRKLEVNKLLTDKSKGRKAEAVVAKTEKMVAGKPRMDTIAGRNEKGRLISNDGRPTLGFVPRRESSEIKSGIKRRKATNRRNRK